VKDRFPGDEHPPKVRAAQSTPAAATRTPGQLGQVQRSGAGEWQQIGKIPIEAYTPVNPELRGARGLDGWRLRP
jgi:hypothetical protein